MLRRLFGSYPVTREATTYISPQRALPYSSQSPIHQGLAREISPILRPSSTQSRKSICMPALQLTGPTSPAPLAYGAPAAVRTRDRRRRREDVVDGVENAEDGTTRDATMLCIHKIGRRC